MSDAIFFCPSLPPTNVIDSSLSYNKCFCAYFRDALIFFFIANINFNKLLANFK